MKLCLLLPLAFAHGPLKEALPPLGPGWIRKESLQKLSVSLSARGDAAALINLLNGTVMAPLTATEKWTRAPLHSNVTGRSLAQLGSALQRSSMSDISGTTLFLWLGGVLSVGLICGVCVPLGVNYYYEEIATAPWLSSLSDLQLRRPRQEAPSAPARSESPDEARRGSSRRRPSRRRDREAKASVNASSGASTDDCGPSDLSAEDRSALSQAVRPVDKASLCYAQLPKVPQEHVGARAISSDESDHSAKHLRHQAELLAATGNRHRLSTESTTAEESTSSISSILRVKGEDHRDSNRQSQSNTDTARSSRGRSPDDLKSQEPRKSSSGKRAVSFDAKVEVQSMEVRSRERSKKRTTSQKQSPPVASKKDPRARRRGHLRSRSPQSDA